MKNDEKCPFCQGIGVIRLRPIRSFGRRSTKICSYCEGRGYLMQCPRCRQKSFIDHDYVCPTCSNKKYVKICPTCKGNGFIRKIELELIKNSNQNTKICTACDGNGLIPI